MQIFFIAVVLSLLITVFLSRLSVRKGRKIPLWQTTIAAMIGTVIAYLAFLLIADGRDAFTLAYWEGGKRGGSVLIPLIAINILASILFAALMLFILRRVEKIPLPDKNPGQ